VPGIRRMFGCGPRGWASLSHHLRVLRNVGLVESERFRYWTYYRLRSDGLARVGRSISALIDAEPAGGRPRRPCC